MDWQAIAGALFRGGRADLPYHDAGTRVSREFSGINLAIETGSAASVSTDWPRVINCVDAPRGRRVRGERDWACSKS